MERRPSGRFEYLNREVLGWKAMWKTQRQKVLESRFPWIGIPRMIPSGNTERRTKVIDRNGSLPTRRQENLYWPRKIRENVDLVPAATAAASCVLEVLFVYVLVLCLREHEVDVKKSSAGLC